MQESEYYKGCMIIQLLKTKWWLDEQKSKRNEELIKSLIENKNDGE